MADAQHQTRKTVRGYWWKERRFAELDCGHSTEISAKDPLPYEAKCLSCPPLEPA